MCDVIPRLILANSFCEFDDYPIITDSYIGDNLLKTLIKFNVKNKEIILIEPWEKVRVEDLIFISFPNYLPHDFKYLDGNSIKNDSYVLSPRIFHLIQSEVNKWEYLRNNSKYKKIYFFRPNKFIPGVQYNLRNILNQDEIMLFLRKRGFTIINIAELSFENQVRVVKSAKIVISPVGAALTNMLFSSRNTIFVGLMGHYEQANYSFWVNFAFAANRKFFPVLGRQIQSGDNNRMHNSYFIPINLLRKCVEDIDNED